MADGGLVNRRKSMTRAERDALRAKVHRDYEFRDAVDRMYAQVRKRSHKAGRPWTITKAEMLALLREQGGMCALTGVPMTLTPDGRDHLAVTIDRIDYARPYEAGNIRYVTFMANVGRSNWGDEAFYAMCEAATRFRLSCAAPQKPLA